jgi:hypothetical protein
MSWRSVNQPTYLGFPQPTYYETSSWLRSTTSAACPAPSVNQTGSSLAHDRTASSQMRQTRNGPTHGFLQSSIAQPPSTQEGTRRRIRVACERCRKRKTRCSGEPTGCESCRITGVNCVFRRVGEMAEEEARRELDIRRSGTAFLSGRGLYHTNDFPPIACQPYWPVSSSYNYNPFTSYNSSLGHCDNSDLTDNQTVQAAHFLAPAISSYANDDLNSLLPLLPPDVQLKPPTEVVNTVPVGWFISATGMPSALQAQTLFSPYTSAERAILSDFKIPQKPGYVAFNLPSRHASRNPFASRTYGGVQKPRMSRPSAHLLPGHS